MGAMLVASLAVPDVFGDDAFLFACAYAIVRIAHLVLYAVAGRGDRDLLAAVARLGSRLAIGVASPLRGGALDGKPQVTSGQSPSPATCWGLTSARPGLASRAGALRRAARADRDHRDRRVDRRARRRREPRARRGRDRRRAARFRGRRRLWWLYFDVVVDRRRASAPRDGRATHSSRWHAIRTAISTCRWSPGSSSSRSGVKKTLGDVGDPLKLVPAVALCGGVAMYLAAHVLFRLRNVHSLSRRRLVATRSAAGAAARRRRVAGARDAGCRRRPLRRPDRLRGDPLRGGP